MRWWDRHDVEELAIYQEADLNVNQALAAFERGALSVDALVRLVLIAVEGVVEPEPFPPNGDVLAAEDWVRDVLEQIEFEAEGALREADPHADDYFYDFENDKFYDDTD